MLKTLLLENKTKDKIKESINKDISKLITIIKQEYGYDINDGGCGVFAKLTHDLLNYDTFLYIFDGREPTDYPPIHILVKISNDKYTDSSGKIYNKKELEVDYSYDEIYDEDVEPVLIEGDISLLNEFYDEMGEGISCRNYRNDYNKIKQKFININY